MVLSVLRKNFQRLLQTHPLKSGMVAYAVLWPTSNIVQQTMHGRDIHSYDWAQALRFAIHGTFIMAPAVFCWITLASAMFPGMSLKSAIMKVIVEQISFGPFAHCVFYIGISLLEFKSLKESFKEASVKLWPTYKVGLYYWPLIQTINNAFIPFNVRIVFNVTFSFIWSIFLSYMKSRNIDEFEKPSPTEGKKRKKRFLKRSQKAE